MPVDSPNLGATIKGWDAYERMRSLLGPEDLILVLAHASPIQGSVRLQKETFLLWKKYTDKVSHPGFYPYKMGPYSRLIDDSVKILKKRGFLEETTGKIYSITDSGRDHIVPICRSLGIDMESIKKQKIRWDEWMARGITTYVYRMYPEYAARTEVPQLKW